MATQLCCGDCSSNPCQCDPPYPGVPEFFPPGTQAIIIPEPYCGAAGSSASAAAAAAAEEEHSPVLGKVLATFSTPASAGQQSQFTAKNASSFVLAGGWIYFPGQGFLKVLSVSTNTITYSLPVQPYGVLASSQIIEGAAFAVLPPLETFPFDIDITTALSAICAGEECACDPVGAEFASLFACEAGDPASFKLIKPPAIVEGQTPVVVSVDGAWQVKVLEDYIPPPAVAPTLPPASYFQAAEIATNQTTANPRVFATVYNASITTAPVGHYTVVGDAIQVNQDGVYAVFFRGSVYQSTGQSYVYAEIQRDGIIYGPRVFQGLTIINQEIAPCVLYSIIPMSAGQRVRAVYNSYTDHLGTTPDTDTLNSLNPAIAMHKLG